MNKLEQEIRAQGKGRNELMKGLKTEADMEESFHYYLPESSEPRPFTFFKLDEGGEVVDSVQMFAMTRTPADRKQQRMEERKASAEAFKTLLTVDVEKQLKEWEEEKKRRVLEEMDKLEEEYEKAI